MSLLCSTHTLTASPTGLAVFKHVCGRGLVLLSWHSHDEYSTLGLPSLPIPHLFLMAEILHKPVHHIRMPCCKTAEQASPQPSYGKGTCHEAMVSADMSPRSNCSAQGARRPCCKHDGAGVLLGGPQRGCGRPSRCSALPAGRRCGVRSSASMAPPSPSSPPGASGRPCGDTPGTCRTSLRHRQAQPFGLQACTSQMQKQSGCEDILCLHACIKMI